MCYIITDIITPLAAVSTLFVTLWVARKNRRNQEYLKYIEEKIKVYEPFVKNLRHCLSSSQEDFDKFTKNVLADCYYAFFIYAPDDKIKLFNEFIDTRINNNEHITYEDLLDLYKNLFLSIRKDVFPDSKLNPSDIRLLISRDKDKKI